MLVIKFIVKCRKLKPSKGPKLSSPVKKVPAILSVLLKQQKNTILVNDNLLNLDMMKLEDLSFTLAATYLFRTTTEEVKQFNKKEKIEKISVESNGILYSKNRILEAMEFKVVTGMEMVNLDPLKVNTKCPVMDRYSPTSYSLAQYIHYEVSGHSGLETCNRLALERVHIIQGVALFREISADCIKCKIKRRRFLEMSMGPIGEHHLNIAPPFYACQGDLFGPVTVYAPGASRELRGRPAKACKVWSLVFACPVTRLVNCQVIELSDHSGVLDGITRLAAEVGFPKYFMVDQDGALMKGLRDAKVNMRDLQHRLYTEHGIVFTTCPVGGHNVHGHVERVIKSVQELLEEGGVKNKRLHATGYQTLLKLVENNYNSLPLGYSYDKSLSNTPLLRIITPNFFKFGRNNDRAMEGPIELPNNGAELIEKVNETYQGLFKLWSEVYIPKLIYQPVWHKDDKDLKEGDLVYMEKDPGNALGSKWIIGIVEQVLPSRDGKIRRVIVKYQNHKEDHPRFTERSVRRLVKIFDIEEYVLQDDLTELIKRMDADMEVSGEEADLVPEIPAEQVEVGQNLQAVCDLVSKVPGEPGYKAPNDRAGSFIKSDNDRAGSILLPSGDLADLPQKVLSSNLSFDSFPIIYHDSVSGAWLQHPVPSCPGQEEGGNIGGGEEQEEGRVEEAGPAGDWRQVPVSLHFTPAQSPSLHLPTRIDNTLHGSIMDHFERAVNSNFIPTYTQDQNPSEDMELMKILKSNNLIYCDRT